MRLVQLLTPEGIRSPVLDVLGEYGIEYVVFEEAGRAGFEATVQVNGFC